MIRFLLIGIFTAVLIAGWVLFQSSDNSGVSVNPVPFKSQTLQDGQGNSLSVENNSEMVVEESIEDSNSMNATSLPPDHDATLSSRPISIAEEVRLPLSGSTPTKNVKHTIPIEEIRQGCFRQDCIPSVDSPVFTSSKEVDILIDDQSIGLALSYKGVNRFYSFNMLVTREIVNDVVAGDPLLVTYCPLCGTGIVFERKVNGEEQEFGVSGMLWQSNLLMYNRAKDIEDRSIWSQAPGEAVVGKEAGEKLMIIPSDIMRYGDWKKANPNGEVLNTGSINDPYNGNYYGVAKNFSPDFDETNSPLDPSEYVYGIEVDGIFKAYTRKDILDGVTNDVIGNSPITITKSDSGEVIFRDADEVTIPDTEGFWFSWVAVHPDTLLFGE